MKQIYYAIQSTLHGRGSNVTKVISLSLGLTIGVLLFSQIAFELNYEKCYPDADRLVLVRGGGENVKTGEKGEGYDDSLFAPMAEAFRSDLSQWIENATVIFNFETLRLSGNFWLVSFKISYLCLPLFYETRTTPSCHPSGCAYRQL